MKEPESLPWTALSLTNKTPGAHGRDFYQRRQQEILFSRVHLVEIDLLRGGKHTTAVPLEWTRKKTGPFDYHVSIHRFDQFVDLFVYPCTVRDMLPEIAVPLLPQHGAVALDLQDVFQRCYDTGPYQRRVRYGEAEIVLPLAEEHAQWAAELLKMVST